MEKVALQLYSVKELTKKDFLGTLADVAKIGYDGVEFAGYFDTPARKLKQSLDEVGLKAAGSHISIDTLNSELDKAIEYSLEIENPFIICPYLPDNMRNSINAYKRTAEFFNQVGLKCNDNGIAFGYHNHDFEFERFDGVYGLDILVNNTEADLMFVELDTFWVEYMDLKSIDFIEKYKERCSILHIKDMKSLEEKNNIEIGKGIIDFNKIISLGRNYGVKWFTVEQEYFEIPQILSIKESLSYLRKIL